MTLRSRNDAADEKRWWRPVVAPVGYAAICLLLLLASSCSPASAPPVSEGGITVAAAANLQSAFGEIGTLFEKETGARVTFVFGSSGNLAKQIENGAPVDVFASAGEDYLQQLSEKGAILPGTERIYGIGRIVLASNKASGVPVAGLQDLTKPEVKHVAVANPDHAPYGLAARQALQATGLWDQIKPKIVYGEDIRQTLQFVQTGNAEVGIVALSIAEVPEVTHSPIDDALYQPLRQPMAVIRGTAREAPARQFVAFVTGPEGRAILKRYGFGLPGEG